MAQIIPDHQIAAGNNNAAGLAKFTAINDSNGIAFVMPRGLPTRTRGELRFRVDGTAARVGKNSYEWRFSVMTLDQYSTMLSTYGADSATNGLITARIAFTSTSFANYNAVLRMPDESELEYIPNIVRLNLKSDIGPGYKDVIAFLTRLEAL
jgi:hypothetical protein